MSMQASVPGGRVASSAIPAIRDIHADDVKGALRQGWQDFSEHPTHYIFMSVIFPVIGFAIALATAGVNLIPLVFPAVAGFALVGPFAALGMYELSRLGERGQEPTWDSVAEITHSPALPAILKLGLLLCAIFCAWMAVAYVLYSIVMGPAAPLEARDFLRTVLTTPAGWALIVVGNVIGAAFAVLVLSISAISFPLLLDRPNTDVGTAIRTSVEVFKVNPKSMTIWGLIVGSLLFLGSIPFFAGLAVVIPLLGHATWHLYRRVIA